MSTEGSARAIIAALGANIGIAVTKFIAAGVGCSASMLSEGIHSVADSGNQVLLLIGGKRARREATKTHPFGYGRSRYIYAFMVSIVLFSIGGMFSINEGISKLHETHELENAWLPLIVLGVSIGLESFSLYTALKAAKEERGRTSLAKYIRHAKSPELPVVLLEDMAALTGLVLAFLGVGLTVITHNAIWDAIGTLAIGVLLVLVAVILGIETSSLLVGEGASDKDADKIKDAIVATPGVDSLIHIKTLYLGPEELMVAAKFAVGKKATAQDIAKAIDDAEVAIRVIYLEPDILRDSKN